MSDPRLCPKCGTPLEPYGEVDIGVGVQQFGPWGCPACHWVEGDEALGEMALPDLPEGDDNDDF